MFSEIHLKNFGVFSDFRWHGHERVNVIVGENDTGKSHLLKVVYAIAKSFETLGAEKAGQAEERSPPAVFSNKLRWTFQPPTGLGALVRDGAKKLTVEALLHGKYHTFSINRSARDQISELTDEESTPRWPKANAIFLPPKEVLTIFAAIEVSRGIHEIYGFDDTYYDLLKLLRMPPTQGKVKRELSSIADELEGFVGGRIIRKGISDDFLFERGKRTYTMPQTADGIKKVGILANLIKSRTIMHDTILILDEPETNLHPRAISIFTDMLFRLGQAGVQIYLATHSYFVIKRLEVLAKQHRTSIPFCSLLRRGGDIEARFSDLSEGMPDNPIIDESIRLYERSFEVDMKRAVR